MPPFLYEGDREAREPSRMAAEFCYVEFLHPRVGSTYLQKR